MTNFLKESSYNGANNTDLEMKMTTMADVLGGGYVFFQFLTKGIYPFGCNEDDISINLCEFNPTNLQGNMYYLT